MPKKESFSPVFYAVVVIQALLSLSFYMVSPIITKYLSEAGIAISVAGLLSGLMSYICLFVRPFSGALADRLDPKKILAVSMCLFGISIMGYGLTSSLVIFALLRMLSGITFCLSSTTIFVFSGQHIPKSRLGEGIGYLGMGNIIASAVGPSVSTWLAETVGYSNAFLIAGAFSLFCTVVLLILPHKQETAQKIAFPRKKLKFSDVLEASLFSIAVLAALFSYTNSTMSNFLLLYADTKQISNASLYFTSLALFLFILRPLTGKLNDRFGLPYILIPGFLMTFIGVFLLLTSKNLWGMIAASFFMAFGQGGGQPAVQAECMRRLGSERKGVATGTYWIFNDIAQGLAPTMGGLLIQRSGYPAVFISCMLLFLLGLGFYLYQLKWAVKS